MRRTLWAISALSMIVVSGVAQDSVTLTTNIGKTARPVSALLEQVRKSDNLSVTYEDIRYPAAPTWTSGSLRLLTDTRN